MFTPAFLAASLCVSWTTAPSRSDLLSAPPQYVAGGPPPSLLALVGPARSVLTAAGKVVYVSKSGSDGNSGLTWQQAKLTIMGGLAVTSPGDEVWVARGTYPESVSLKEGVALFGGFNGTEGFRAERNWNVNHSVLDGQDSISLVLADDGITSAARIDGFVIQHSAGSAIRCYRSSPVIMNNLIQDNATNYMGGAVYGEGSSAWIVGNTILRNRAAYGGGLDFQDGGAPVVEKNTISDNVATLTGGGIRYYNGVVATVSGNTISGNTAGYAGGIDVGYPSPNSYILSNTIRNNVSNEGGGGIAVDGTSYPLIANNIIANNTARSTSMSGDYTGGGGILCTEFSRPMIVANTIVGNTTLPGYGGGVRIAWSSSATISGNIIAFNTSAWERRANGVFQGGVNCIFGNTYSNNGIGAGDIFVDPQFVDRTSGDYHLQRSSPCINKGDNSYVQQGWADIDGQPRIMGGTVDIGADETNYGGGGGGQGSSGGTWANGGLVVELFDPPKPPGRIRPRTLNTAWIGQGDEANVFGYQNDHRLEKCLAFLRRHGVTRANVCLGAFMGDGWTIKHWHPTQALTETSDSALLALGESLLACRSDVALDAYLSISTSSQWPLFDQVDLGNEAVRALIVQKAESVMVLTAPGSSTPVFSGLHLDIEPLGNQFFAGGIALLRELRSAFPNLRITVATGPVRIFGHSDFDLYPFEFRQVLDAVSEADTMLYLAIPDDDGATNQEGMDRITEQIRLTEPIALAVGRSADIGVGIGTHYSEHSSIPINQRIIHAQFQCLGVAGAVQGLSVPPAWVRGFSGFRYEWGRQGGDPRGFGQEWGDLDASWRPDLWRPDVFPGDIEFEIPMESLTGVNVTKPLKILKATLVVSSRVSVPVYPNMAYQIGAIAPGQDRSVFVSFDRGAGIPGASGFILLWVQEPGKLQKILKVPVTMP